MYGTCENDRNCTSRFFLHGFLTSFVNCVWIVAVHALLYDTYMAHHPEQTAMMEKMPSINPRVAMFVIGPVIGVVSGLVLGLFCFIASRLVKPAHRNTPVA